MAIAVDNLADAESLNDADEAADEAAEMEKEAAALEDVSLIKIHVRRAAGRGYS